MPIYNDVKSLAAKKLVENIRKLIDTAYDAIVAEAGMCREEKACLMLEIHNNYTRNNTLMTEVTKVYKTAAEEPEQP
jgi:hypothetical protein